MQKIFTVSFFIDEVSPGDTIMLFDKMCKILPAYFKEHERILFLHCADNTTDSFVHKAVISVRKEFAEENYITARIYPHCLSGYMHCLKNTHIGTMYYEKHFCFHDAKDGDASTAHITRNKKMVEISDLSFFYVKETDGISDNTLKYAKEQKKEIIIL